MRSIKKILLFNLLLIVGYSSDAQKKIFDVVSYNLPKAWQIKQNEGGIQLSVTNKTSGAYAIAVITKAIVSDKAANENFTNQWTSLVKTAVQVNDEPTMQDPANDNGWSVISGNANYTDGAIKGVATLLCATGGGKTVSVVLMTNAQQYKKELVSFITSLKLSKVSQNNQSNSPAPAITGKTTNISVAGLWTYYTLETMGNSINGSPQYTAGYARKEYAFYPNGTYIFRNKQWITKTKDILFVYETGTYAVNGNQLTITPNSGKGGFWQKKTSTKEWGLLLKASDYKPEKVNYTFTVEKDPTYGTKLILRSTKSTQRDGGSEPFEFRYSFRDVESLIDNPPGFKTGS